MLGLWKFNHNHLRALMLGCPYGELEFDVTFSKMISDFRFQVSDLKTYILFQYKYMINII